MLVGFYAPCKGLGEKSIARGSRFSPDAKNNKSLSENEGTTLLLIQRVLGLCPENPDSALPICLQSFHSFDMSSFYSVRNLEKMEIKAMDSMTWIGSLSTASVGCFSV